MRERNIDTSCILALILSAAFVLGLVFFSRPANARPWGEYCKMVRAQAQPYTLAQLRALADFYNIDEPTRRKISRCLRGWK